LAVTTTSMTHTIISIVPRPTILNMKILATESSRIAMITTPQKEILSPETSSLVMETAVADLEKSLEEEKVTAMMSSARSS